MATVNLDTLTTLAAVEDRGAVVQMTREVFVTGLASTDFGVLFEALDEAGVPAIGSSPTGYDNLVLVKRNPQLVPDEKTKVRVVLEYVAKRDAGYDFTMSGGGSLRQITTAVDLAGNDLSVSHTFSTGDPDSEYAGQTYSQGGQCNVMMPQGDLQCTGIMAADYPQRTALYWDGAINSTWWIGSPPYTWMIVNVTFEPHDMGASPRTWEFTFQFQFNNEPYGWRPRYSFIDPRTGRPPTGLVEGTGKKTLTWYSARDFNELFAV